MLTISLIRGILTRGQKFVPLQHDLEGRGYKTRIIDIPWYTWHIGWAPHYARWLASEVAKRVPPGQPVIAHSGGCYLHYLAQRYHDLESGPTLWLGAAMSSKIVVPHEGCTSLDLWYNRQDNAVLLGSILPAHGFGALGRVGYRGPPDRRIRSIEIDVDAPDPCNHSVYLTDDALRARVVGEWLPRVTRYCRAHCWVHLPA